jgi:ATP phosphoribosyltransferase
MSMLRVAVPNKGILADFATEMLAEAGYAVRKDSKTLRVVDSNNNIEFFYLRPRDIATYVGTGALDLGITGRDWIEETSSDVVSLGELRYSKATSQPVRVVVAVADSSPAQTGKDLKDGVRVTTEYPEMTRRYFAERGIKADIRLSYGASEAKIPDIADCVVDITETGRALRASGLRIIDTVLTSYTELIANKESYADPVKRHAMQQIMTLLTGTLEARDKVLLKLNVAESSLEAVLALLPAAKSPTVSRLASGDVAVESVVPKRGINTLIPDLIDAGASDLLEIPISKIIH